MKPGSDVPMTPAFVTLSPVYWAGASLKPRRYTASRRLAEVILSPVYWAGASLKRP